MNTSYPILDPHACETDAAGGACALGVMTKAPRAGASKTRLVPPLTHEEAARLSVAFLRDTAANVSDACAESSRDARAVHPFAVYTPAGSESDFAELLPTNFALLTQRGDTFGARLFNAVYDLLRLGYESCCLVDSDSPTLPRALLSTAADALSRPGDRLVLGPADDGGYYLIGLKHAHARLFEEIAWSTADVLTQTIERAREISLDVELLPAWYDVDDASTLRRLHDELFNTHDDRHAREASQLDSHRATELDSRAATELDSHIATELDPRLATQLISQLTTQHISLPATQLVPYHAPHTRAALARLFDGEGRTRLPHNFAFARALEGGGA